MLEMLSHRCEPAPDVRCKTVMFQPHNHPYILPVAVQATGGLKPKLPPKTKNFTLVDCPLERLRKAERQAVPPLACPALVCLSGAHLAYECADRTARMHGARPPSIQGNLAACGRGRDVLFGEVSQKEQVELPFSGA
jgi:hypothetical protein